MLNCVLLCKNKLFQSLSAMTMAAVTHINYTSMVMEKPCPEAEVGEEFSDEAVLTVSKLVVNVVGTHTEVARLWQHCNKIINLVVTSKHHPR